MTIKKRLIVFFTTLLLLSLFTGCIVRKQFTPEQSTQHFYSYMSKVESLTEKEQITYLKQEEGTCGAVNISINTSSQIFIEMQNFDEGETVHIKLSKKSDFSEHELQFFCDIVNIFAPFNPSVNQMQSFLKDSKTTIPEEDWAESSLFEKELLLGSYFDMDIVHYIVEENSLHTLEYGETTRDENFQ